MCKYSGEGEAWYAQGQKEGDEQGGKGSIPLFGRGKHFP